MSKSNNLRWLPQVVSVDKLLETESEMEVSHSHSKNCKVKVEVLKKRIQPNLDDTLELVLSPVKSIKGKEAVMETFKS